MNKTKIEWCDYTWNPITGCLEGCSYCYARGIYRRFKKSFKPVFHPGRLSQPSRIRKPSRIFVCSVSDFWGRGTDQAWRDKVYRVIKACPQHTFLFLTKQPQRIRDFARMPENCWIGVTYTCREDCWRIAQLIYRTHNSKKIFVSYEPMLGCNSSYLMLGSWLIIGALTGPLAKKHTPDISALKEIIKDCKRLKLPVFMKDNLKPYWSGELIQEFPDCEAFYKDRLWLAK